MKDIQQLIKKNSQEGRYEDIFPKTFIDAVEDRESGNNLTEILSGFNMYFLSYNGSRELTRLQIPLSLRKTGLWITYVLYNKTVVTEWYAGEAIDDDSWKSSDNWRVGSNMLVGDISISSDGYWVVNGVVTTTKAHGEQGITPMLRVGSNNHLQLSYTNGSSWVDISTNPVYTQFRVHKNKLEQSVDLGATWVVVSDELAYQFRNSGNKLQVSKDLGVTWEDTSDYIAAWFKFTGTTESSQVDNVGKIQISRDNGSSWSDLSGEFTNSLHIKGYVTTVPNLPSTAVQGDIYGVGPTYDPSDTEQTNPIYQLYVKDSTGWVNNGKFTSISAGVVQTTGTSTTEVMSQKAVTDEINQLVGELSDYENKLLDNKVNLYLGYNHVNPNKLVEGKINPLTGEVEGTAWKTTDFIEWGEFDIFYIGYINEKGVATGLSFEVAQYNKDREYLGVLTKTSAPTRMDEATYFRFHTYQSVFIASPIHLSNVPLFSYYNPIAKGVGVNDITFKESENKLILNSDNLVLTSEYIPNSIFTTTKEGIYFFDRNVLSTFRIKVKPNTIYSRTKPDIKEENTAVGFFKDKDRPSDILAYSQETTFTTPDDCEYIVITGLKSHNLIVVEGSIIESKKRPLTINTKDGYKIDLKTDNDTFMYSTLDVLNAEKGEENKKYIVYDDNINNGIYEWNNGIYQKTGDYPKKDKLEISKVIKDGLISYDTEYNFANPDTFIIGVINSLTGKVEGTVWRTSPFYEWGDETIVYVGNYDNITGNSRSSAGYIAQYDIDKNYLGERLTASSIDKAEGAMYFRVSTSAVIPLISFIRPNNIPLFSPFKPKVTQIGSNKAIFANDAIQNVELYPNENLVSTAEFLSNSQFKNDVKGIGFQNTYSLSVIRIKVKPNTTYTRTKPNYAAEYLYVGFFKDKDNQSDILPYSEETTFTTPIDCNYIVINGGKSSNLTVVEGDIVKSITPEVLLKSKDGFPVRPYLPTVAGKNKFDKHSMIIKGKLVNYETKEITDSTTSDIAIIPISNGVTYTRNFINTGVVEPYTGILELKSYNFDTGEYSVISGYNLMTFKPNSSTKYIAIQIKHGSTSIADILQLEEGRVSSKYEPYEKRVTFEEKFRPYLTQEFMDAVIANLPEVLPSENNTVKDMKEIKKLPSNYDVILDDKNFRAYAPIRKHSDTAPNIYPKIVAVGGNVVVYAWAAYVIEISETGYDGLVMINNTTNPNRKQLSFNLQSVHVLPYSRNATSNGIVNDYRVIIVATNGKIYHNKPYRSSDKTDMPLEGDHLIFEESVIWDMPHRRLPHPTNNEFPYYKNPCVTEVEHSPKLNTDPTFEDVNGNGGYGISKQVGSVRMPRFMIRFNGVDQNPFRTMGGVVLEPSNMWLGTYIPTQLPDKATRLCVFNTKDGVEFYNKYEFITSNLCGTPLNTTSLPAYTANTLAIVDRDMDFPKEEYIPTALFRTAAKVNIASISIGEKAIVTTAEPHGLALPQGIIAIKTADGATVQNEYKWMLNDDVTEDDYGNNLFFAYKKLTPTTFEIHEYISANNNNLQARHIHTLNRCKDGVTIGTGEEYYTREGVLSTTNLEGFYPQTHIVHLTPKGVGTSLNSSEKGLMRPLGFILMDDAEQTVLHASDSDIAGKDVAMVDGKTLYRGATGLFKGKLSDINDRTKFETVFESPNVCYFFQKIRDVYIYIDVHGYMGLSTDLINWSTTYVGGTVFKYGGIDLLNRIVVDGIILYKK